MATHITKIELENKEIWLIGTAHVSSASAEEVRQLLQEIKPDAVAIELDDGRYKTMTEGTDWQKTDIVQVIKSKRVGFLLANIILSSYQQRLAKQLNVQVGSEMSTAITEATAINAAIVCIDRNIQTTFTRIWRSMRGWDKFKMMLTLVSSIFEDEKISEAEIEELKQGDMIQAALHEVGSQFPRIAEVLINERDQVMAYKLKNTDASRIVAVVGAAHVPGITKHIQTITSVDHLLEVPQKSKTSVVISWLFPIVLVLLLLLSMMKVPSLAMNTVYKFILINGSFAALGTAIALGHPLSIITAFVMAPVGALSPVLATGWFAGLMEAYIHKPKVEDFMALQADAGTLKGFWRNRVIRILLVVVLANLFSTIGTLIFSADLIQNLFK